MKEKIKEIYFSIMIFLIFIFPIIHLYEVIRVAGTQGELRKLQVELGEYKKRSQSMKIELENKIDLEKIETEARKKLNMEISNEIKYFKVE